MSESDALLESARRMLAVAERDLELGLPDSACLTAHRAAAMATQAWLERRGQAWVSDRVRENVGLSPAAGESVRADAELLDRHRADEARRWEPAVAGGADEARAVLDAACRILAFVDERIAGE
jgi:HEPN domain-containing protein